MSLRQAFRSRFKSSEKDTDSPSRRTENGKGDEASRRSSLSYKEASSPVSSPVGSRAPDIICDDDDDANPLTSSMYELQLNQLQEQLVAAMIENQGLDDDEFLTGEDDDSSADELQEYRQQQKVVALEKDLALERQRVDYLAKQLDDVQSKQESSEWVDLAHEVQEEDELSPSPPTSRTWRQRVVVAVMSMFYEVMQDFSSEPLGPQENGGDKEEDQLAVKKLKDNIKRFKSGSKPIYTTVKGIRSVLLWKYPTSTMLAFVIYMYSVWHSWLLPVFLFLLIFRLFINYLRHKGLNINITYFAEYEDDDKGKESELGMSDKFNLVLQVARKVQNTLGEAADALEKLKNLFTWKQPEATCKLFLALCAAFVSSCLLPGETLFFLGGLYMGVKWFVIEYVYHRFPRIKAKHDTVHRIWQTLPTDCELGRRSHQQAIHKNVLPCTETTGALSACGPGDASLRGSAGRLSEDDTQFIQLFDLPITEMPLHGWEGGRRCTLVNKEKSLTSAFKHGKLYLTNSFLCFERYKYASPKNLMLALSDIASVVKAKPYAWLPGGGMSIEVTMAEADKAYIFCALLSRDEAFTSIIQHAAKMELDWAKRKTPPVDGGEGKGEDTLSMASQSSSSPRHSPARVRKSNSLQDTEAGDTDKDK